MSRVGQRAIVVPQGVEVTMKGSEVMVTGPKGQLSRSFHPDMSIGLKDGLPPIILIDSPIKMNFFRVGLIGFQQGQCVVDQRKSKSTVRAVHLSDESIAENQTGPGVFNCGGHIHFRQRNRIDAVGAGPPRRPFEQGFPIFGPPGSIRGSDGDRIRYTDGMRIG